MKMNLLYQIPKKIQIVPKWKKKRDQKQQII